MPATSQLDKLISITAISVLSCSKTIRDWFRSFGFCIGGLHRVTSATMCAISSPPPHSISKRTMCRPTRRPTRGRLKWLGEMSEEYAQLLHRGIGGGMYTRKAHETREAPRRGQRCKMETLRAAYEMAKSNEGATGIDG